MLLEALNFHVNNGVVKISVKEKKVGLPQWSVWCVYECNPSKTE
jgi:hypothetical protein